VPRELEELRAAASTQGLSVETAVADVADATRTQELADDIHQRFGAVDVLVNNAGIIVVKPIGETSMDEYDRVLATNLRGPFLYCRAFLERMRSRGRGAIINVSSESGIKGFPGESAYCASKFGLEGLTRTLSLELEGTGVFVISVTPGAPMRTLMSDTTYSKEMRGKWIEPELIAPGIVELVLADERVSGGRFSAYRVATDGVEAGRQQV
jgi:NAD(P)-dependent dehydrogenase (short-subunit alcohol dehydrogenase family)